jgi:predicted metal-dependent hydrolase
MTDFGELPQEFWQGVAQFNRQEFYDCHDTLEALWMEAMEPDRTFYQGILQIAVGFYHLGNQNCQGAMILLGEGIGRLRTYQPDYGGIAINHFIHQTQIVLHTLQRITPGSPLPPLSMPKIQSLA